MVLVNNGGAGREDPDAVLLKSKVYSNSEKVKKKQKAQLSRIIKILKLWQEITTKTTATMVK